MTYPLSDHFDGAHFRNPGLPPRPYTPIAHWMLTRRKAAWPAHIPNPPFPPPGSVGAGEVGVTFIGHSTFLLRFGLPGGGVFGVLTDPVFSERCSPSQWFGPKRVRAPGVALEALPPVDAVLVSHNHYDHMDLPSLHALHRRFGAPVVTALGNAQTIMRSTGGRGTELDWWGETAVGPLHVTATPAQHFSSRGLHDRDRALWCGFMLGVGGARMLFAGDSGHGPHWGAIPARLGAPALALLPIGAYLPRAVMAPVHMDPAEAVQARADLGAAQAVGMHFGTWQLTDEGVDDPVLALQAARDGAGLAREQFDVLGFGETRVFSLG